MDIAVPSRFACLRIEDDDFRPASSNKSKKKVENKQQQQQQQNKKQEKSTKQDSKKNINKPVGGMKMITSIDIIKIIFYRPTLPVQTKNRKRNNKQIQNNGRNGKKKTTN